MNVELCLRCRKHKVSHPYIAISAEIMKIDGEDCVSLLMFACTLDGTGYCSKTARLNDVSKTMIKMFDEITCDYDDSYYFFDVSETFEFLKVFFGNVGLVEDSWDDCPWIFEHELYDLVVAKEMSENCSVEERGLKKDVQ